MVSLVFLKFSAMTLIFFLTAVDCSELHSLNLLLSRKDVCSISADSLKYRG